MLSKLFDSLEGLFFLVVAFSYSIFMLLVTAFHLPLEGGLLHVYSAALFFVVLLLFFYKITRIPNMILRTTFLLCILVVFLYYITRFFYQGNNEYYNSYFLSMGVRFIPSIIAAAYLVQDENILNKIELGLYPFILFYTTILGSHVLGSTVSDNLVITYNTEGLNYQTISYYSIFAYGLTLYLISNTEKPKIVNYLLYILVLCQLYISISAGGRGAFVLAIIFTFYFERKYFSVKNIILSIFFFTIAYLILGTTISENAQFMKGFDRLIDFFGDSNSIEDDGRWVRYSAAFDSFLESPIWGNGIGSIFYKIGFYSHNIFTDILCEGGLLLFCIFLRIFYKFYSCSVFLIQENHQNEIFVIIFLCSFVNLLFSGYYLSVSGLWLSLAFILFKYKNKFIEI